MRDTTHLIVALGHLFALLPPDKEPLALALANTDYKKWTEGQIDYLWKTVKKYEFTLKTIGVPVPPNPVAPIKLPDEPYFLDFIQGKFVMRLSEQQAESISMVPRAKYDRKTNLYSVPQRMYPVLQLHKFVKHVGLFCTQAAQDAVLWMYKEMRERYHASMAHDADIDMGDFGLALDPYQRAGIKGAARFQRGWIADEMGLGKTRQALGVLHTSKAFPALVLCPASVPINWERETRQAFPNIRIARITKRNMPSHTCKSQQLSLLAPDTGFDASCKACCILHADVVICNYDKLAVGWKNGFEVDEKTGKKTKIKGYKRQKGERADVELSEVAGVLKGRGFTGIIADESHYLKEETSQRTKASIEIAQAAKIRLALSGNPTKNRPKEIIPQAVFLDRLDDLGGRDVFCREFCGAAMIDGKYDDTGSSNETLLNKYLRSIGYVQRRKRDVRSELPPIRYAEVWVEIDNREEYERVEEDVVNWCAEQAVLREEFQKLLNNIDPSMHGAAIERKMIETRLRIMRVQALIRVGALKKVASQGKLNAAKEWIRDFKESGNPIVIFAHFRDIQYALGAELNCLHMYGKDSVGARQKHRDIFMREAVNDTGLSASEIVCSFGAVREGVNLDGADDILLYDSQWTPVDEDQAIARIDRHRVHNITAWRMYAENTVDEKIKAKLEAKRRITDAINKGERGPASEAELDILGEVVSDLAAMSARKVDRSLVALSAQAILREHRDAGPGAIEAEAAQLEKSLEAAV
jgi:SWI/SNF-related matrix-associated actin-dependent regulator 1 of chromatin subfamily A